MTKTINKKNNEKDNKKAEAKKAKLLEKKAAAKAKKAAKRAAKLEKKRIQALKKKERKAAMKAKKLARLEKQKAKKLAIKEKKRLAKEKQKAKLLAKKIKNNKISTQDVDIREAAKMMKMALTQIANDMVGLDLDKRIKKAKAIHGLGYVVNAGDNEVIVMFDVKKIKKDKLLKENKQPTENEQPKVSEPIANVEVSDTIIEDEPKVEIVPSGDLFGTDGEVSEMSSSFDSDETNESEDDNFAEGDNTITDSRDETDDDLVDARRDFFNDAAEFGDDVEN